MTASRPNLFIVGAPKCGTTSLHWYLSQHPDIYMSCFKEPHFFATDLPRRHAWGISDEQRYMALFENARGQRWLGESSTWYLYSRAAPDNIKTFCEDARIIVMLRDPVDAICSMFHQNVRNGNESVQDLEDALMLEPHRHSGSQIPPWSPFPSDLLYTSMVEYATQVSRYCEVFGRRNVLIILFDDFVRDVSAEFARVLAFLSVDPTFRPDFSVQNSARAVRNVAVRRFLLRTPGLSGILERTLSPQIRHMIGNFIAATFPARNPTPVIRDDTKAALARQLRPERDRLSRLLAVDLTHWCQHA